MLKTFMCGDLSALLKNLLFTHESPMCSFIFPDILHILQTVCYVTVLYDGSPSVTIARLAAKF